MAAYVVAAAFLALTTTSADAAPNGTTVSSPTPPPPTPPGSACPADFPHAGSDAAGIWGARSNRGACGKDNEFPSELQYSVYCFDGEGGIDADLSRAPVDRNTSGCMSFGTDSCPMEKEDIKEVQFVASSSGCFNSASDHVWACPLWLTPQHWIAPQSKSGEVDFIERCGSSEGNGMATNFGWGAGSGQSSFPIPGDISQPSVFYYKFNSPSYGGSDSVEGWKCSPAANPIKDGTAGCIHIGTNTGYYGRTHHSERRANLFEMVSDIWNTATSQAGSCSPTSSSFNNRQCKYRVNGLKTTFYKSPSWSSDSPCRTHLLVNQSESESVIV